MTWERLYDQDGVIVGRQTPEGYDDAHASFIVADHEFAQFKLSFFPLDTGKVSPGVAAQWSEDKPGELASYTHEIQCDCDHTELTIDDAGLLTALARPYLRPTQLDFRSGFTLQLPATFVPAVRFALEAAFTAAREKAKRKEAAEAEVLAAQDREPTADEAAGINWWNALPIEDRKHWSSKAGNTGRAADAWAAFKASRGSQ